MIRCIWSHCKFPFQSNSCFCTLWDGSLCVAPGGAGEQMVPPHRQSVCFLFIHDIYIPFSFWEAQSSLHVTASGLLFTTIYPACPCSAAARQHHSEQCVCPSHFFLGKEKVTSHKSSLGRFVLSVHTFLCCCYEGRLSTSSDSSYSLLEIDHCNVDE